MDALSLKIKRLSYRVRHDYLTLNNVVTVIALFIGILFSHPLNYAFGNFLGIFLGFMAAQKLLIKKA